MLRPLDIANRLFCIVALSAGLLFSLACSEGASDPRADGQTAGGATNTAGALSTSGSSSAGAPAGGMPSTDATGARGGAAGRGGNAASGGTTNSGGNTASSGSMASGGSTASGGTAASGSGSGGASATGGTQSSGAAGTAASGGDVAAAVAANLDARGVTSMLEVTEKEMAALAERHAAEVKATRAAVETLQAAALSVLARVLIGAL